MRAKPKAPATAPSCQSASAAPRPSSGSSAGNAPIENVCSPVVRQSMASRRSGRIGGGSGGERGARAGVGGGVGAEQVGGASARGGHVIGGRLPPAAGGD